MANERPQAYQSVGITLVSAFCFITRRSGGIESIGIWQPKYEEDKWLLAGMTELSFWHSK
jgi:hypothetical protein